MKRQWGAAIAAVCVLGLGLAMLPEMVEAQKVANPGTFSLSSTGGAIRIQNPPTVNVDLQPRPLPQCSDGVDNDGDNRIDLVDNGCAPGPAGQPATDDDSELAFGFQPKTEVSISGSIDTEGNIAIPRANIVFPTGYIPFVNPIDGYTDIIATNIVATAPATGRLDPLTGNANIDLAFKVRISGTVAGNYISADCSIGTDANPIRLNMITGTKAAVGGGNALTGSIYNQSSGIAVLVENNFAVPGASNCWAGWLDFSGNLNNTLRLPAPPGASVAYVSGRTTPTIARAVNPIITPAANTNNNRPVPHTVTFSGATSTVSKGPATYRWEFSDGTTATGITAEKTFTTPGQHFARLIMTDTDGDTATALSVFTLVAGTGSTTTTTTLPTTTTTTTLPTTTTTTTLPTTTTTTTLPTTTTTSTLPTTTTTSTLPTTTTTTTLPTTTTTSTTLPTATTTSTLPTTTSTLPPTTSTTSTTVPQPSNDSVTVSVNGSHTYSNNGSGNGDLTVRRDAFGITSVTGQLDIPGKSGGSARVTVNAQRAWILPLWSGQISIVDQGAGVNITTPILGSLQRAGSDSSVTSTASWFRVGAFPNLIRPYSVNWTVTDAG